MGAYPYTLMDYTRGFGPFPMVTHGYHYSPDYSAYATERGADVFMDGQQIASFETMDAACKFVTEQSNRNAPWWMRPASGMSASGQDPQGLEAKPASPTAESGDAQ